MARHRTPRAADLSRHTYRLDLAYDGGAFAGFRQQPGLRTVESTLLDALRDYVPGLPAVAVGGRTDRGVHANGQVVSFWTRSPLPLDRVRAALDAVAPHEIAVRQLCEVPRSFHASFSALGRCYRYCLGTDGQVDPSRLDALLEPLQGRRCFSAFARRTPAGKTTVRHLQRARTARDERGRLCIDFAANSFLRRQVRVMVATAMREARRGAAPDALLRLCANGDRRATEPPAAPGGLYLTRIAYPPQ